MSISGEFPEPPKPAVAESFTPIVPAGSRNEAGPVAELSPPVPHLEAVPALEPDSRALQRRVVANTLSIGRAVGGAVLAYHVAKSEYPPTSWAPAAAVGLLALTDYADGRVARSASKIDGQKSVFGAYADQMSDKVLVDGLMGATAYASYRSGRRGIGHLLTAATGVTVARDTWVTAKRVQAERAAATINTAAQKSGKIKAAVQFAGLAAAVAPVVKNKWVNRAVTGVLLGSTYLAAKSGLEYNQAYNRAMRHQPSPVLEAVPTEG
jgi:phosphatidylglycerophosphate synthase